MPSHDGRLAYIALVVAVVEGYRCLSLTPTPAQAGCCVCVCVVVSVDRRVCLSHYERGSHCCYSPSLIAILALISHSWSWVLYELLSSGLLLLTICTACTHTCGFVAQQMLHLKIHMAACALSLGLSTHSPHTTQSKRLPHHCLLICCSSTLLLSS